MKSLSNISKWKVIGLSIVILFLGSIAFGFYSYCENTVPVSNLNNLKKTNYRIYYQKSRSSNIISSEINGEDKRKLNIPSFGECSPDSNYTLYSVGDSKERIYLYNFKTQNKTKIIEFASDTLPILRWAADGTKFAVFKLPYFVDETTITPMTFVFNKKGKLLKKKEIPENKYDKVDFDHKITENYKEKILGEPLYNCETKRRGEKFRYDKYRYRGFDVGFGNWESASGLGLYYKEKKIFPRIEGFKGGSIVNIKNILPDGKVIFTAPRSTARNPLAMLFDSYYIYVYIPKTDSLYRVTKSGYNEINWRFEKNNN